MKQESFAFGLWCQKYAEDCKALGIIGMVYLVLEFVFHITCPIKFLTGVSCAGCGMSRAWLALLRLDIAGAFSYHPLFVLPVVFAGAYLLQERFPRGYRMVVTGIVIAFLGVYLYRLFDKTDMIVVFQPKDGFLWKCVSWLWKHIKT